MRIPSETEEVRPRKKHRIRWLVAIFAILVLIVILQGISGFYINFLWFRSYHMSAVWKVILAYKLGLGAVFIVVGFLICWVNVWLIERAAPPALALGYERKYVQSFQRSFMTKRMAVRFLVSILFALVFGIGASGQWRNWLLFEHAVAFGKVDPIFHRDISYFIFRLPFLTFVVSWMQLVIIFSIIIALVGHVLSGAIHINERKLRVEPRAMAHISLLLAGFALFRAWAYYYVDRFTLEFSHDGVVAGASYLDIHVRLPADNLLTIVSLAAFFILVVNIYHRKLSLLIISAGIWVLLVLSLEVVYPAVLEAFQVLPQQNTLELPSIKNNILATRFASGISSVHKASFPANQDLNYGVVKQFSTEIDDALLWDPNIISQTLTDLQGVGSPDILTNPQPDRYVIGGHNVPVILSVKAVSNQLDKGQGWVVNHIVDTHGQGIVAIAGNTSVTSEGKPQFLNLHSTQDTSLSLTDKGSMVYYSPIAGTYTIVSTQSSIDKHRSANKTSKLAPTYSGLGLGLNSFLVRLASAIHLDSASILFSNQVNASSKLLPITNVTQEIQKSLPFLEVSDNPYPVVSNGQLYWLDSAYATSSYYPNAQPLDSSLLPSGSVLHVQSNFIRDAVIAVENASTGNMNFYILPGKDPLMQSYAETFPSLFEPIKDMPTTLRKHLLYPENLFVLQSAIYGLYHVGSPSIFYNSLDAWQVPISGQFETKGFKQKIPVRRTMQGVFRPQYEFLSSENGRTNNFYLVEPLVPYSSTGSEQNIVSFLTVSSDEKTFGSISAYNISADKNITGPTLASNQILLSKELINLSNKLNKAGSEVVAGQIEILPIADSLLYLEPLYVFSPGSQLMRLYGVAAYYKTHIVIGTTQQNAVEQIFASGSHINLPPVSISSQVQQLIVTAGSDATIAEKALNQGNLGRYQLYEQYSHQAISKAEEILGQVPDKTSAKKSSRPPKKQASLGSAARNAKLSA